MQAIILAGGKGTRLKPFTNVIPKPLVPIGEMPILEVILRQLSRYGVKDVTLAVNHLARLIQAFFGNGNELGLNINYSLEDKILGTAGPLRLVPALEENFFVMNGDILTTIDYSALMNTHISNGNDLTIATFSKKVKIDLGVLKLEDGLLVDYIEKPEYSFDVSMGIYACSLSILECIPADERYDIPQLALELKRRGRRVGCYSEPCEWLDIGRIEDYETAVSLFEEHKGAYLPN